MPMHKFSILFWIFFIYSLKIISVVPQKFKMYEIDLRSSSPVKYDFYIKNYFPSNDNIPIITEVKSPQSNIQGFICIHSNRTNNTYIKNLYCFSKDFTDTNQIFCQFYFSKELGQKNILNIQIPSILLNNALESQNSIVVKKNSENISKIGLTILNTFTDFVLSNKLNIILLSCQLFDDLVNNPASRIMHTLGKNDYILAFFDRDYGKIIGFFREFISLLQKDNEILQNELPEFSKNFMENNLNTFWIYELMGSGLAFDDFKNYNLSNCFFTDITNLLSLIEDPNHKFELNDYDQSIGSLSGCSLVAVLIHFQEEVNEKNLECFAYDNEKNKLEFKVMIDSKKRLVFFMFDLQYLKEFNIRQVDCIAQTPIKHYVSRNISLISYF